MSKWISSRGNIATPPLCPELRPEKIIFTTYQQKWVTMRIILSARKCCGHRASSNGESEIAVSGVWEIEPGGPPTLPKYRQSQGLEQSRHRYQVFLRPH